ncbi:hypothetical protein BDQ17DRAFT_1193409, partial [Cyathus striatus]
AAICAAMAVATLVLSQKHANPRPKHTSVLTGQGWLNELLQGHPQHIYEQLGLSKYAFQKLSRELQTFHSLSSGQHVSADE